MKYCYFRFILISFLVILVSCENKEKKELELLQVYLDEHNITTEPTKSGLYYIETFTGTGEQPIYGDYVTIDYEGRLINGEIFDSSYERGKTLSFIVGSGDVIRGMDEGIRYMKNGGRATLIMPSSLGYGSEATQTIPAYSTLIFDIELLGVYNK
jgi:FKBP-type peptidyl-prolyl cis-trans isomerase